MFPIKKNQFCPTDQDLEVFWFEQLVSYSDSSQDKVKTLWKVAFYFFAGDRVCLRVRNGGSLQGQFVQILQQDPGGWILSSSYCGCYSQSGKLTAAVVIKCTVSTYGWSSGH